MYLDSTSTQSKSDVESSAFFHINPHREWFYEYEEYDVGDVLLGDNSLTKIFE